MAINSQIELITQCHCGKRSRKRVAEATQPCPKGFMERSRMTEGRSLRIRQRELEAPGAEGKPSAQTLLPSDLWIQAPSFTTEGVWESSKLLTNIKTFFLLPSSFFPLPSSLLLHVDGKYFCPSTYDLEQQFINPRNQIYLI